MQQRLPRRSGWILPSSFPVYLDESAMRNAYIVVSAGQKGLQIRLAPADYVRATSAKVALIARPPASQ